MGRQHRLEHRYRVRFDEAGAEGWLRTSGFLRYTQDMAWRHSEEAGFDREWYAERGINWVVRNVRVLIDRRVTYGDVLAISTEVIGWRHVWVRRHCQIRRTGGGTGSADELLATVDTDWVLLTEDVRPARVPREIVDYVASATAFTRDRVVLPEPAGQVTTLSTRVRPLDVDPLRHMNNAAYPRPGRGCLASMPRAAPGRSRLHRVGYVRPALPGSVVEVRCWPASERQLACRISDGEGQELTKVLLGRSGE